MSRVFSGSVWCGASKSHWNRKSMEVGGGNAGDEEEISWRSNILPTTRVKYDNNNRKAENWWVLLMNRKYIIISWVGFIYVHFLDLLYVLYLVVVVFSLLLICKIIWVILHTFSLIYKQLSQQDYTATIANNLSLGH